MARLIDADALFAVVKGHHDLYNGATNPTDKARRDENLQVMCDITDAPIIPAIPVAWLREKIDGYASRLKSRELDSLVTVLAMWQKEQE